MQVARILRSTLCFALCCTLGLLFLGLPVLAQEGHGEGKMSPEMAAATEAMAQAMATGPEHAHLAEQVGKYNLTITAWMQPGASPSVMQGTAERTMSLGGRVLEERVAADVMGMPMEGLGRTGFDNVTGKYWSTWTDNLSTAITLMEGTWDEEAQIGVFEGESSDPMAGKKIPMRIEMRMEGEKEISTFYMSGPDGEMIKSMEIVYVKQ